jgi:hypothetical protein
MPDTNTIQQIAANKWWESLGPRKFLMKRKYFPDVKSSLKGADILDIYNWEHPGKSPEEMERDIEQRKDVEPNYTSEVMNSEYLKLKKENKMLRDSLEALSKHTGELLDAPETTHGVCVSKYRYLFNELELHHKGAKLILEQTK